MPADDDYVCVGRQTVPFDTMRAIDWGDLGSRAGLSALVHDAAFLQVALNVLLFVPLGWYVRRIARRGVVVATLLGFGISLLIETTQATGVWHLYDCAYRLFDVDDLMINTLGAALGSLVSAIFIRRKRPEVVWPSAITLGRRLVGMVCDVLFVVLLGSALSVAWRAVQLYVVEVPFEDLPTTPERLLQWGVPGLIEAAAVLLGGRTVGEWVVAVRTVRRRGPVPLARLVKLATGVGPMIVLLAVPGTWTGSALLLFVVVTVIAAIPRAGGHRGLAHAAAGLDLEIVLPRSARDRVRSAA
jgi:glycopeptide antibiotics resistance protein